MKARTIIGKTALAAAITLTTLATGAWAADDPAASAARSNAR